MSATPLLAELRRNGFPMGGEPSIAVDFVDTVYRDGPATTVDLLQDPQTLWWNIEAGRLVDASRPDRLQATRLRTALRTAFESAIAGVPVSDDVIDELNHFVDLVPTSPRLKTADGRLVAETYWHGDAGADANLSLIARDGIELLLHPERLRKCANPQCLMIFVADNPRRIWCRSDSCGNRARVARHYNHHRVNLTNANSQHDRKAIS